MKLVISKEAVTPTSAVLCWDRIEGASAYQVLLDGVTEYSGTMKHALSCGRSMPSVN